MTKSLPRVRRAPSQDRALHTVNAILDATAQVIEQHGLLGLTTNKVAVKSGFSIGTLYQYFHNKEVLLARLVTRGREIVLADLHAYLLQVEALDRPELLHPQDLFREFIRIQIGGLAKGGHFRRKVIRQCWRMENVDETAEAIREISDRIMICLQRIQHPLLRKPTPALMFTVSRAVTGVIRSASLENAAWLDSRELEDELVQLVWGLMAKKSLL